MRQNTNEAEKLRSLLRKSSFVSPSVFTLWLKLDISDLQNDWCLQVLIFGTIDITHFLFLELFVFSMSDIKQVWCMTWLTLAYLMFGRSGIEHYQKLRVADIIYYRFMMPKCLVLCIYSKMASSRPLEFFFFFSKNNLRFCCAKINDDKYKLFWVSVMLTIKYA